MKKTLLLIMAVALCTSLMAQYQTPAALNKQAVPMTKNLTTVGASIQDADATIPTTRPSIMLSEPGYGFYLTGQTHYYLPTNTNSRNTISFRQSSPHAAACWTTANRQNNSRGTGINYYDVAEENWRPLPPANARIETAVRTGWGAHGFTSQGEIVVAHNGLANDEGGLVVNTRDHWGQDDWNQYVLKCTPYTMSDDWQGLETYDATGLLWPTMVTNGNTVHLIAVTEQWPFDGNNDPCDEYPHGYVVNGKNYSTVPLYYRSTDGGKTWDIQEHHFGNEGMTDYEFRKITGDSYVLAVRGEHVVFLFESTGGFINYMESWDNGSTWAKKEVYSCADFIDPVAAPLPDRLMPSTSAIYIDENHKVHVAFGTKVTFKENGNCHTWIRSFLPAGMVYWNSDHDPINWEDLAVDISESGDYYSSAFYSYPRYIDLPTVLGFDKFYLWVGGPEYNTDQFRDNGWAIHPRIVARDGRVFLSYQSLLDWPLSPSGGNFYRGIFMTVSEDDGETWEVQKNTSWLSYHPELFQANWDDFEEPEYAGNDTWIWDPNSISVSTRTENAYPTMSSNMKDSRVFLQWYHKEGPFMDENNPFLFDPVLIYTLNQGLWMFPEFNNIQEIWQGKWNKIDENTQPTVSAKIFPNPATDGMVYVQVDTDAPYTVAVTNIMGQVVHTTQETQDMAKINISTFAPGVYIVNVKTDKAITSQKLIVK